MTDQEHREIALYAAQRDLRHFSDNFAGHINNLVNNLRVEILP